MACPRRVPETAYPEMHAVSPEEAVARLPAEVKAPEIWAEAILRALAANAIHPSVTAYCSVVAVTSQESSFQENPKVSGLGKVVRKQLDARAAKFGPLGRAAMARLLKTRMKGSSGTFEERIARLETERDVDQLFHDILAYYRSEYPGTYVAASIVGELFSAHGLEDLNPVTTAGSMQVSVRFAQDWARARGRERERIREELYTVDGGLHYGVARLLVYDAEYDDTKYRFADYNAGLYASRNAALQEQLRTLVGGNLVLDGDFLAYDRGGEPLLLRLTQSRQAVERFRERYVPSLSHAQVQDDLRSEKTKAFEETDTYQAVKRVFRDRTGNPAPYARIPNVAIKSPKMKQDRSTSWYAQSVQAHFDACLARAPKR
jgi:hypothetical protein